MPRPSSCSRAVQRQLYRPTDKAWIWISDDVLKSSFRRFASSTPGPLECRRRMGKRRMTLQSDQHISPISQLGHLWSFLPEVDRTKWTWQAPTNRVDVEPVAIPLLREEKKKTQNVIWSPEILEPVSQIHLSRVKENILRFRRFVWHYDDSYSDALRQVKQDISLGLVSLEMWESLLQEITPKRSFGAYRLSTKDQSRLLAIYQTTWEAMAACKVLRPTDFDGQVLSRFLSLVARIRFTKESRNIAKSVIMSTTPAQQRDMVLGIKLIVLAWSRSFSTAHTSRYTFPERIQKSLRATGNAAAALSETSLTIEGLRECLSTVRSYGEHCFQNPPIITPEIRNKLFRARAAVCTAVEAIEEADSIQNPLKISIRDLSITLDCLSPKFLSTFIPRWLNRNLSTLREPISRNTSLLYGILSTVARMSKVSDHLFIFVWKMLMPHIVWKDYVFGEFVLLHWISQGLLTKPKETTNAFLALRNRNLATLIITLDKYRQYSMSRARELIIFLEEIGKPEEVALLLQGLKDTGQAKLPVTTLAMSIDMMGKYDNRLAVDAYRHHTRLCATDHCHRRLSTYFQKEFFTTLIHDPNIEPYTIWNLVGVPYPSRFIAKQRPAKYLTKNEIDLINHIALEFARCKHRPTSTAFRNVVMAFRYLYWRQAPIQQSISKALAHAGITREIEASNFIQRDRLRYVLCIIEGVEGKGAADRVEDVVYKWRQHLSQESELHYRQAMEGQ